MASYEGAVDMMDDGFLGDLYDAGESSTIVEGRTVLIDADMDLYAAAHVAEGKGFETGVEVLQYKIKNAIENSRAESRILYLTGAGNFREELATIAQYKGNRGHGCPGDADLLPDGWEFLPTPASEKPEWFGMLKEYLINEMGAVVCEGQEADDAMSMKQYAANISGGLDAVKRCECPHTVISSGDKDLDISAGWHLDPKTGELYWCDPIGELVLKTMANKSKTKKLTGSGLMFFLAQLLMGDSTDNIMGAAWLDKGLAKAYGTKNLRGFGAVKAYDCLKDLPSTPQGFRDGIARVWEIYQANNFPKCYLIENMQLLWMRSLPGQLIDWAGLVKYMEAYGYETK